MLELGRRCDRSGRLDEAFRAYEAAIALGEGSPAEAPILAEALRRLAVMLQRRGESEPARRMCQRSYDVAAAAGDTHLCAEALNTFGGLGLTRERLDEAHEYLERALALSEAFPELRGRIEQNLGILFNIRGDRATALSHYERSLQAFIAAGSDHGCAVAYNNLGMINADQQDWEAADQFFEQGRKTAQQVGDEHLRGLCLMNRVEALIALERLDTAQLAAEMALSIFEELHALDSIAEVQRMLGMVFRETGRMGLARSRLELAIELASVTGSAMGRGKALCEMARLHGKLAELDLAVDALTLACRCFSEVPITLDGAEVIRGEYPSFVRTWCELVRAVDATTADHADRVAVLARDMAGRLRLPAAEQAAIRVAAQLHEVGVLRPLRGVVTEHRPSDDSDPRCYDSHPATGAELLAGAACFDGVVPIVRGLGEFVDGTGNPDGVRAGAIPLGSQILGLADAYDRLVHGHGDRLPAARHDALASLAKARRQWRADAYEALVAVTAALPLVA
jgi:HD-GYP domain-containing protein (c-di-GMP phosphodiesterase class II)